MIHNEAEARAQMTEELGLLGIIARPRTRENITIMATARYAAVPTNLYRVDNEGVAVAPAEGQTELFISYQALADLGVALGIFDGFLDNKDNKQEQQNG